MQQVPPENLNKMSTDGDTVVAGCSSSGGNLFRHGAGVAAQKIIRIKRHKLDTLTKVSCCSADNAKQMPITAVALMYLK